MPINDVLMSDSESTGLLSRLERSIDRSGGEDACHPFIGALDRYGYGKLKWNGRLWKAHRAVAVANRRIALGSATQVLHRCDNPSCCNERHYFYGTQAENMRDREAKGRGRHQYKLDQDKVEEIRLLRSQGTPFRKIASDFGVALRTVEKVVNGGTWKHARFPQSKVDALFSK